MQYTVRAAALATGVSEDRLRTWERRYGIPAPSRTGGGHRLYSDPDMDVIRRMVSLLDAGMSAAAAAAAVHAETDVAAERGPRELVKELDPRVTGLVDATERLDDMLLLDLLRTAECSLGVEAALDCIALPALVEAGRRWERGGFTVAQEHLLSEAIRTWLVYHTYAVPDPASDAPRILVGCPEDERHDLSAVALTLLLRRSGMRVSYVGADVPAAALVDAIRAVRFDAVCLSVTATTSLPVARLACAALLGVRGRTRLFVGGRAIVGARAGEADGIAAVRLPAELRASADVVIAHVRGLAHQSAEAQ